MGKRAVRETHAGLVVVGDPDAKTVAVPRGGASGRALERGPTTQRDIAIFHSIYPCLTGVCSKFSNTT
jgi:hypothetical protein